MNTFLLCAIIAFLIVYGYDWLHFPQEVAARVASKFLHRSVSTDCVKLPKIFECSLCATTWSTLLVLLIMSPKFWFIAFAYGFATPYILEVINLIDRFIRIVLFSIGKLFKLIESKL